MPRALRYVAPTMIIVLIGVWVLTIWQSGWTDGFFGDNNVEATAASAVVEEDGFTIALDGATVSAAASVAPLGTSVQARLIDHYLPESFSDFAEPVGKGIEVILGDHLQPASPITIVFAADEASSWVMDSDYGSDSLMVAISSRDGGLGAELADAQLLSDGSVIVTTDHLSLIMLARASIGRFAKWFGEQVLITLQVRSPQPDCVGQQEDAPGWRFSAVPQQYLWTCAAESRSGVTATFTNNSTVVWFVESDEATPGNPVQSSSTSILTTALAWRVIDYRTTAPVAPPDVSVTFAANDPDDEIVFNVSLNKSLTLAGAIWNAASSFLPASRVERIAKAVGKGDCLTNIVSTAIGEPDSLSGEFVATVTSCMGALIEGTGGALFSSVTTFPALGVASGTISHASLSGQDHFSITLSRVAEPAAVPTASPTEVATPTATLEDASANTAWPTKRHDNPRGLYTWLGANMFGFPDWSACDDAATWCLVGYEGGSHLVVRMNGLEPVGEVEDSVADPRQALLALGMPDASVTQILRA